MEEKPEALEGKLEELQEEYSKTKYNKATNKHLGLLRAKIARAKRDIVASRKRRHGSGFFVKKVGDATVGLVGFPSTGKSSLINSICNTKSKVAQYAFTTTTIIPGVMLFNGTHIQIFDMPGLIEGAHLGAGGGIAVISAMRVADLLIFVIDVTAPEHLGVLISELEKLNIHMNRRRPDVQVTESSANIGIRVDVNKSGMPTRDVETILAGLGMHNVHVKIRERIAEDELIALLAGKSLYINAIVALNKIDLNDSYKQVADRLSKEHAIKVVPVSAKQGYNLNRLKEEIYRNLGIMTVRLIPKGGREEGTPIVVRKGSTVGDVARKFHTDIIDELKCAYVTGKSAKFPNQRVGVAHALEDGDRITFIKER